MGHEPQSIDELKKQLQALLKFPDQNPNPVLKITMDGKLLYTNNAGQYIKEEWEIDIGDNVPSSVVDQSKLDSSLPLELEVGNKTYAFHVVAVPEFDFINIYGTDVTANRILEDKNEEMEQELQDATQMQMSLLPKSAPEIGGFQIAGSSVATKEVGGDFFDYLIPEDDQQISIAVGDVSGKGLRGAMNAVMSSGILRLASKNESNVSAVMSEVNTSLCYNMEQDMNVTMVLAQFDHSKKQLTLTNAGQHAYPLLIRNDSIEPIKAKGLALGMIPAIPYKSTTVGLESGDLLLLMTDGITEPRNAEGVMYEESGRLAEVLSNMPAEMPMDELVDTIINDVEDYTAVEEQDDDITLVAVRVS